MQPLGGESKRNARPAERPVRRSQEERSIATKALVLEAATELLFEQGYAAATVQSVAARAGVSRGAMLHHFPSKVDLLGAVVNAAHQADLVYLREQLERIPAPVDRVKALPRLTWHVLSGRSGVAVLEIMMGSRSDPALAVALGPIQARIDAESQAGVGQLMREAGMQVNAEAFELIRVIVAAIRGLAIEEMFRRSRSKVPAALHVFESLIETRLQLQASTARGVKDSGARVVAPSAASRRLSPNTNGRGSISPQK